MAHAHPETDKVDQLCLVITASTADSSAWNNLWLLDTQLRTWDFIIWLTTFGFTSFFPFFWQPFTICFVFIIFIISVALIPTMRRCWNRGICEEFGFLTFSLLCENQIWCWIIINIVLINICMSACVYMCVCTVTLVCWCRTGWYNTGCVPKIWHVSIFLFVVSKK